MLYLIADRDGGVEEVIEARNFKEAYKKVEENSAELIIELDEETIKEIEKRSGNLKIVKFMYKGEVIWETEFFSNLSEDDLQEAVDNGTEELDEQMETWTGEDLIRLMEKKGQIRTPSFSVDRCEIEI